ncbi:MAG TPA: HNH endonuclease [Devosia sp.]|nr:HNH endonuclease [Devosia sp.]
MPSKPPQQKPAGQQTRAQQRRVYDDRRDQRPWRRWYKTAAWQRRRRQQLLDEPLCAYCLREGRITAATVADHVEPHRGDEDLFWNGELQSLCDQAPWRCHSRVKQQEESHGS